MSTPQDSTSPSRRRPRHQHSKSANQAPTNGGKTPQRRQKGNRANNSRNAPDSAIADSSVQSSEEVSVPPGPRNAKKHTSRPQPVPSRSPNSIPTAALTDSEIYPNYISATPAKETAYAGPTFHASPAASALPKPKFLSKSVPAKPRAGPANLEEEGSDSASSMPPSPPSPSRAPIVVPGSNRESPLDWLFNADRAERARNGNGSPRPVSFSNSLNPSSANLHGNRSQQGSYSSAGSSNTMFPFELDAENRNQPNGTIKGYQNSENNQNIPPPLASPATRSSATAPRAIPQAPKNEECISELSNRLSQSQKKDIHSTPPRMVGRIPSEPSSRHQTPSPFYDDKSFRSASGPTTPAPSAQQSSVGFLYGNRNLSPMFKAAMNDVVIQRHSGLRTEIGADGSPTINGVSNSEANSKQRDRALSPFDAPTGPRRGSLPQIPPFKGSPNNRKTRTPGGRLYRPLPDSYRHSNNDGATDGNAVSKSKSTVANPFIPASVQAKQFSTAPKASDILSLERDLKQMLNVEQRETAGVR